MLQSDANRSIDKPVVQVTVVVVMVITHVIELTIGIDEVSSEIVGHRQAGVKVERDATTELLFAHGSDAQTVIKPLIPFLVRYVIV